MDHHCLVTQNAGRKNGKTATIPHFTAIDALQGVTSGNSVASERDARTGGRAVECTGLENRQGCKPFVGSNPTLSANSLHARHSD